MHKKNYKMLLVVVVRELINKCKFSLYSAYHKFPG